MESIKEFQNPVEYSISKDIKIFEDNVGLNSRFDESRDTSSYEIPSKRTIQKMSRKYLHEHTDLGTKTVVITCPNCLLSIQSNVRYTKSNMTHVAAVCLFPICLCALPYCTRYFRNAEHYCPMCSVYLGTRFAKGGKSIKCCGTKISEN